MSTIAQDPPLREVERDEQARLDSCALEPIRRPGAVQPHGAVIVVDAATFEVVHASANSSTFMGTAPQNLIGRPLADVVDPETGDQLRAVLDDDRSAANPAVVTVGGYLLDAIVHRSDDLVIIDLE